ncbi:MAG: glycerate kinase [Chloroflexi bacterium]|nr:MAG: glycerate kinase [Chloroflexota bacterium]
MTPRFSNYREHIDELVHAALAAVDPATAVSRHLTRQDNKLIINQTTTIDLAQGRLFLVSAGKAALPMLDAAAHKVGDALTAAIAVTKVIPSPYQPPHPAIQIHQGSHPISDEKSVSATTAVHKFLQQTTANDLVLCLISGGASALLTKPLIPLADWQALNQAMLASGCTINEFNTVRRQLDAVKGGGLSSWAAPSHTISLILSDVVGNPLEFIGSGPTVPGTDTAADAMQVLQQYDIAKQLDNAAWQAISKQVVAGHEQPTGNSVAAPDHVIIGDVRKAAEAALHKVQELGFSSQLLTAQLAGEAREVGLVTAAIAKDTPPNHCLILGGETTVTLRGQGKGGRSLETALSAALALDGWPHRVVASFATDGEDGSTDVAGAVVTGTTVASGKPEINAIAYLNHNDSYHYFQKLDEQETAHTLIKTGSTGTNVNDLVIILTYQT